MKIYFVDFWGGFENSLNNNFFVSLLKRYNILFEINKDSPDILFYSVFGNEHLNSKYKNSKKIFYTGENSNKLIRGPFYRKPYDKMANLNLTFEYTNNFNNIRLPLWILYMGGGYPKRDLINLKLKPKKSLGFCSFVFSNNVIFRNNFCKKISKYKKIACGGGCLNNIGGKIKNKIEFQKKFKFCIAFENTLQKGYTTEKIFEAYLSNCIPIYKGNPNIISDFNPETFVNGNNFKTDEDLINYIIKIDNDNKLYQSFMNKPIFSKKWIDIFNDPNEEYFKNIVKNIIK